jgi:arylsulfatase A-like enzyme
VDDVLTDRREVLRAAMGLSLAGALPALASCNEASRAATPPGAAPPPNIVFIMADDLGYADLSCYGRRDYTTPRIDALAAGGIRLTQGYANSCVCSATRVGLITGRYQYRVPVGLQEPINDENHPYMLPPGHPTLPSLLRDYGYRTALVGKWHIGTSAAANPNNYGYDHFFGYNGGGTSYYPLPNPADPRPDEILRNADPVAWNGYLTDVLGDEAARWIASGGAKPFFLSLHFSAAHFPWTAPGDVAGALTWSDAFDRNRGNAEVFAKMVGSLDQNVGKVLDAVDSLGLGPNTIVVFTSDNGGERFSDMWPLTGAKGELLEGGIRVPLIVRWPGRIAAGTTSQQVMISMDFLPTLLAAAKGAPHPLYPPDGENLLPVLTGAAPVRPRRLFWRHKTADQAALREGDWKYLRLGGKEHLFNLAEDARERADKGMIATTQLAAMRDAHAAWSATMLPYPADSFSYDVKELDADRY